MGKNLVHLESFVSFLVDILDVLGAGSVEREEFGRGFLRDETTAKILVVR